MVSWLDTRLPRRWRNLKDVAPLIPGARVLDPKVFHSISLFFALPYCRCLFSGWYPSIGRSSDPNEEASSDDKYDVVSSDYVVIEMNASH